MRHDAHFVDELVKRSSTHVGAFVPLSLIDAIRPPRSQMGDLDELTASVRRKACWSRSGAQLGRRPLSIISGERRYRAASAAGLKSIRGSSWTSMTARFWSIALVENIQRKDLTPLRGPRVHDPSGEVWIPHEKSRM